MTKKNKRAKFTDEHVEFIRNNVGGRSFKELTILFNQHFGTDFTNRQIKGLADTHKLRNNIDTKFQKGYVPSHAQEIGSITTYQNGVKKGEKVIKVDDSPNKSKNWVSLARYVWEQHNGEIPKGFMVYQVDGDIDNYDIDNLELVNFSEHMIMTNNNLRYTGDKELFTAGLTMAKIIKQTVEIENRHLK